MLAAPAVPAVAHAQAVETDLRTGIFIEPSSTSHMRVITPSVSLSATPIDLLSVHAGYSADVVSGASESVKAGPTFSDAPDIVSAASVRPSARKRSRRSRTA